jgi:membrane protein required for colicin V production
MAPSFFRRLAATFMNWADWVIIAILVVSSLISIKRGFVKEALSLVNWVLAFFIAVAFRDVLATLLVDYISTPSIRDMAAFAALFAATLIVGAMVSNLIAELVRLTGLSGTDRTFGMVFGLLRGFIIVMAIIIFVPMVVPINEDGWWRASLLIPELLELEGWCRSITKEVAELFGSFFNKKELF